MIKLESIKSLFWIVLDRKIFLRSSIPRLCIYTETCQRIVTNPATVKTVNTTKEKIVDSKKPGQGREICHGKLITMHKHRRNHTTQCLAIRRENCELIRLEDKTNEPKHRK